MYILESSETVISLLSLLSFFITKSLIFKWWWYCFKH